MSGYVGTSRQDRLEGAWHQLEGVQRPGCERSRVLAWNSCGHVAAFPDQRQLEYFHGQESQPRHWKIADVQMAAMSSEMVCAAVAGGDGIWIRARHCQSAHLCTTGASDEVVEAVACSDDFAAVLTSRQLLRVYGGSHGLPLAVMSMAGPSVALAARGNLLLAITTRGPGSEALEFQLIDVEKSLVRAAGRMPLSRGARLRWVGLSAELAPVSIDSAGMVRTLLWKQQGDVVGTWGQWVPIGDFSEEERRVGPLWTVHVRCGVIFCAEVGPSKEEPLPCTWEPDIAQMTPGGFGHGAALREIPWRLPVGPLPKATAALEEALRERMIADYLEELTAESMPVPEEWSAKVGGPAKTWKSKCMYLFGQLVIAGDVDRALEVAKKFMAPAGASALTMAQQFADKAGQRKLADDIAEVANGGALKATVEYEKMSTADYINRMRRRRQRVAKEEVKTSELTKALFAPGELDAYKTGADETAQPGSELSQSGQEATRSDGKLCTRCHFRLEATSLWCRMCGAKAPDRVLGDVKRAPSDPDAPPPAPRIEEGKLSRFLQLRRKAQTAEKSTAVPTNPFSVKQAVQTASRKRLQEPQLAAAQSEPAKKVQRTLPVMTKADVFKRRSVVNSA